MILFLLLHYAFNVYTFLLIIRIICSWVPELYRYAAIQYVCRLTDPYLNWFKKIIPPIGMIDISPIFAFLALQLLESILGSLLGYLFSFYLKF